MCDRTTAIQYLITNQYGSKKELKEEIHEHYDTFVATGFIYEPARIPESMASKSKRTQVREWIATSEAYDRARMLSIKPDKDRRLPSTPESRLKTRKTSLLSYLFKHIG